MSGNSEEEFLNIMKHNGMEDFLRSEALVAMKITEIVEGMASLSEALMYVSDFLNASAQSYAATTAGDPAWHPALTEEQIVTIRELFAASKAFNTIITSEYEEEEEDEEEEDDDDD